MIHGKTVEWIERFYHWASAQFAKQSAVLTIIGMSVCLSVRLSHAGLGSVRFIEEFEMVHPGLGIIPYAVLHYIRLDFGDYFSP